MIDLSDLFIKNCLTALPANERAALLHALREEPPLRGMRFRPDIALERVQPILPGNYQRIPWCGNAFIIDADSRAGAHPLHEAGAYYLQEPSAMAPAIALDAKPFERVLDLCAAPGGKCTQIAGMMGGKGVLVANEIVPSRAKVLSRNMERMGIPNAIVTNEPPFKLAERWGAFFDRVLADAPCSGEGMFRRDPESRAAWSYESIAGCAVRQLKILDSAATLLREGGTLVYSTCTFNEIENAEVVQRFLRGHPEFSIVDFEIPGAGRSDGGCLRLWPHRVVGEGHFVAKLRKRGVEAVRSGNPEKPLDRGRQAKYDGGYYQSLGNDRVLPRAASTFGLPPDKGLYRSHSRVDVSGLLPELINCNTTVDGTLLRAGERFWVLPNDVPNITGIRALRTGLAVCMIRGKTIVPDHALALSLPADSFARREDITEKEAYRYLEGEPLSGKGKKGFVLVCFEGFALGFAKRVDGVLKNCLPKGLRKRGSPPCPWAEELP